MDFKNVELTGDRFYVFAQAIRMYDSQVNINFGTVVTTGGTAVGLSPYYFGYDGNSIYRRSMFNVNIANVNTTGTGSIFSNARVIPAVGPTIDSCSYSIKVGTMVLPTTDVGYFAFTGKGSTFVIDVDKADLKGAVLNFNGGSYDSCTFIVRGNFESTLPLLAISGGTFTSNCRIIFEGDFKVTSANPIVSITGGTIPANVISFRGCRLSTNNASCFSSSSSVTISMSGTTLLKPLGSNVLVNGDYFLGGRSYVSTSLTQTSPVLTHNNTSGDIDWFVVSSDPESTVTANAGDVAIRTNGDILSKTGTGNTGWSKFLRLKDALGAGAKRPLAWTGTDWAPASDILLQVTDDYGFVINNTSTTGFTGFAVKSANTLIAEQQYSESGGSAIISFTAKDFSGGVNEFFKYDGTNKTMTLGSVGNVKLVTANVVIEPFTTITAAGSLSANYSVQYIDLASTGTVTIPTTFPDGTLLNLYNVSATTDATVSAGSGETLSAGSILLGQDQPLILRKKGTIWYQF